MNEKDKIILNIEKAKEDYFKEREEKERLQRKKEELQIEVDDILVEKIRILKKEIGLAKAEAEFWRLKYIKEIGAKHMRGAFGDERKGD